MRNYAVIVCSCVAAFLSQSLQAQSTPDTDQSKLDEIIVTAEKRSENLQSVPVSVQVVSSQTLAEQNLNTLETVSETLPAVHIGNHGGFSNDLFIRGIGSGADNPGFDQSVATFIDDIYVDRSRAIGAAFLDLDRIEVLKGPQSTFFGNNAIAGALNIVTKRPGDTFEGWGRVLYGMYGQYAAEGAVTLPLGDKLSIRAAATFNGGSGWIKNVNTGDDAPDANNKAGRLTALYKPTDDLDILFKVEAGENRISGTALDQPTQWGNCPPPAPFLLINAAQCARVLALNATTPGTIPVGLDNNENSGLPGQGSQLSTFEDVLTMNFRQWEHTFTSVTGFYSYHFNEQFDQIDLPQFLQTTEDPESFHQFSQELRVASPTGGVIEYLAGAYFQTDHYAEQLDINAPQYDVFGIPFKIPAADLPFSLYPGFSQSEKVYSVFGSLKWNVTDQLRLNAGLRASRTDKNAIGTLHYGTSGQLYGDFEPIPPAIEANWSPLEGPPGSVNSSRSDKALMPSAGIQYQILAQTMAYFSYNKGFKAGGFNGLIPVGPNNHIEFGPKHVNAYELGLKSQFFDNTVRLNLDVFRSDYDGLQVSEFQYQPLAMDSIAFVQNAAKSVSQGIELEGQWAIIKEFRLGANVTYLDSHYVSYPGAAPSTLQNQCYYNAYTLPYCAQYPTTYLGGQPVQNLSGQATAYAPRVSGSLTASYTLTLPGDYKFITQLNPYFTTKYFINGGSGDTTLEVGGYTRLDGRLTLQSPNGRWSVDVIGKNLADRIIITNPGLGIESKEEPRNAAVQFRYQF